MEKRNAKYLEDFRMNDYLGTYFGILSDRSNPKIELTYNNYANHAFYSTAADINDLENTKNFVNNGRRAIPSITLWYLALEAFINNLCKVTCLVLAKDPEEPINMEMGKRLNLLLNLLGYDDIAVKKTGIYNRIKDFRQFRNELFHDRNTGKKIVFKCNRHYLIGQ